MDSKPDSGDDNTARILELENRIRLLETGKPTSRTSRIHHKRLLKPVNGVDRYEKLELLGVGGFGAAYLVRDRRNEKELVMKEINMGGVPQSMRDAARREVELLQRFRHPNIVGYQESFLDKRKLHIIMEYCDFGDLSDRIGRKEQFHGMFTEREALDIFCRICLAIELIQINNEMDIDLKAQNLFLLDNGMVKVDFGLGSLSNTQDDLCLYVSPEVCKGEKYNHKSDIWALGVILYELLTLQVPFYASDEDSIFRAIVEQDPKPLSEIYSLELRSLVTSLLSKDFRKRPSIDELLNETLLQNNIAQMLSDDHVCVEWKEYVQGSVLDEIKLRDMEVPEMEEHEEKKIAESEVEVSPSVIRRQNLMTRLMNDDTSKRPSINELYDEPHILEDIIKLCSDGHMPDGVKKYFLGSTFDECRSKLIKLSALKSLSTREKAEASFLSDCFYHEKKPTKLGFKLLLDMTSPNSRYIQSETVSFLKDIVT
eukprot:TRINITY_DN555_c0_g1_i1.p1 TRINITY_DN555_c0_g1~~TRINITY_DN555_c0_g1_i1.p1  ORF type:complete len:484 (-),score=114.05 TRINITY_DN555_c0_g1_i1:860-2311(-)